MHRIIAPGTERSKLKNIWFTELGADRIGTVKLSKKRKGPSTAFQDQDQDQDQAEADAAFWGYTAPIPRTSE